MTAYYNEHDPYAAEWLRMLILLGEIAPGDVDERDISDVTPGDLAGYTQCHFFAGIGGWSHALRLAGWPDDRPVWTGSCPCQPFSAAGKGAGFADERHLWPAWFHLIEQCRPAIVFGEQVAAKAALQWFDLVCADLEAAGYAVGAADLCAAGVGAPHIRQRLYWAADTQRGAAERRGHDLGATPRSAESEAWKRQQVRAEPGASDDVDELADAASAQPGLTGRPISQTEARVQCRIEHDGCGAPRIVGNAQRDGLRISRRAAADLPNESNHWSLLEWLQCSDGKARPTEPGLQPLAHGVPNRVGRLRAYGNAIVPQVASEFIGAYLESEIA
jgi:DNA (cytosine-5)-methyltransferase 1